jgi:hypothetical protein
MTYCSKQCKARDNFEAVSDDSHSEIIPILPVSHHEQLSSNYTGRDMDGISAWAAQIPPSASPQEYECPLYTSSSIPSSSSLRPPKLLLPHRKALPPSLSLSTPKPATPEPSVPIQAPAQSMSELVNHLGGGSMTSLLTDSVATPTSGILAERAAPASFLSHLASQVRSWVASSSHPQQHQPTIVGVDVSFPFALKSSAYLPDDDLAHFATPVKVESASHQVNYMFDDDEDDDDEYDDDISYHRAPAKDATPTPYSRADSESSSSILDALVDDFYPEIEFRGRPAVRCVS